MKILLDFSISSEIVGKELVITLNGSKIRDQVFNKNAQLKLNNITSGYIQDRTIYEDKEIFARNLKNQKFLNKEKLLNHFRMDSNKRSNWK